MKEIRMLLLLVATVGVIGSCTKTETKVSTATANGTLLAGAVGASKSWTLTSISQSINGGTSVAATGVPACETDNVYKFSNNASQDYISTEGSSKCTSTDPSTIESGTWAFTDNGKTLLIEGATNVTNDEVQSADHYLLGYLVLTQIGPLSVVKITDSSVTLTYSFTYSSSNYLITIVLQKV